MCVDGGFTYYVTVRIADKSNQPIEDAHVVIFEGDYDLYVYYWDAGSVDTLDFMGYEATDVSGMVTVPVSTGLSWGGCGARRPRKPPIPENPTSLLVLVEYPYGNVRYQNFQVADDQAITRRSGELDIDLGTFLIDLPEVPGIERSSDSTLNEGADAGPDAGEAREEDAGQDMEDLGDR